MNVYGVGGASPSLNLLSDLLGMRWGKDSDGAGVFQRVWEMVQEGSDGVGETNGGEDVGASRGYRLRASKSELSGPGT